MSLAISNLKRSKQDRPCCTAHVEHIVEFMHNETEPVKRLKTNRQFEDEGDTLIDWDPNNPLS